MLKDSQTHRRSKCSTFYTARHICSQAQLVQHIISKSVYLLGTTAWVIRVLKNIIMFIGNSSINIFDKQKKVNFVNFFNTKFSSTILFAL